VRQLTPFHQSHESVPPRHVYGIYLLTSATNSRLDFPMPLSIPLQDYKTIGQLFLGLVVFFMSKTSRSCPPTRANSKPCYMHVRNGATGLRNRMQMNTQKTKVMVFFETPSQQMARGAQHQHSLALPPSTSALHSLPLTLTLTSLRKYFIFKT